MTKGRFACSSGKTACQRDVLRRESLAFSGTSEPEMQAVLRKLATLTAEAQPGMSVLQVGAALFVPRLVQADNCTSASRHVIVSLELAQGWVGGFELGLGLL